MRQRNPLIENAETRAKGKSSLELSLAFDEYPKQKADQYS